MVHRVCHLGGRSIENSSTSSEKVVAGSIFIRGATSRPPGWTKKRNQFDFLGESRRRVDILTWCTEYVTRVDEEAKPVRLPRRKSSPGRYSYVVHREYVTRVTKKRNQFDFLGESRRRVGIHTWCTDVAVSIPPYWLVSDRCLGLLLVSIQQSQIQRRVTPLVPYVAHPEKHLQQAVVVLHPSSDHVERNLSVFVGVIRIGAFPQHQFDRFDDIQATWKRASPMLLS
ncbi:unnamed protein product [Trichogramma brassicae]|uniref:Uncharacterized protein n=1 Tax=Trichogramma brassicae TaxID=86971 RepID=A0A6H5I3Q8_9HYME|nr:unnamed protein product [Trichogramma brassicae]